MIRVATIEDIDELSSMSGRFIAYAPHAKALDVCEADWRAAIAMVIEHGRVFVAQIDGVIVGMLMAVCTPSWFAPKTLVATELAWWMDPEHRGGMSAIRLVKAFEQWAKQSGASVASMCELVIEGQPPVGEMIERMGYAPSERTYMKEI